MNHFTGAHINNYWILYSMVIIIIYYSQKLINCLLNYRISPVGIWFISTPCKKMALAGKNKCIIFFTDYTIWSPIFHTIHKFSIESFRIDRLQKWFSKMQEDRLLPWKSVAISCTWDKRTRLPIWIQWNYDLSCCWWNYFQFLF